MHSTTPVDYIGGLMLGVLGLVYATHQGVAAWTADAHLEMDATKASKSCEVRMLNSAAAFTGERVVLV